MNTTGSKAKRKAEQAPDSEAAKLPNTDGWLTRDQASDLLRCSIQTIKNYERRKRLHPAHGVRRDSKGNERVMLVYNPKELSELPSISPGMQLKVATREPGEQAAKAFELFRQGLALDEIVIELRETPDRIDQLHERWLDLTNARYVITLDVKKSLEQIVGAFASVTELVELITKKLTSA